MTDRQRDKLIDRQTDIQRDQGTGKEIDRLKRQTDRETDLQGNRQRDRLVRQIVRQMHRQRDS